MSEVHTEDIRRDSDGRTSHVTLFRGLAGYMELPKDIGCYIKVINNWGLTPSGYICLDYCTKIK